MATTYHNPLNTRLTAAQQQENAVYIRDYFLARGWSINAICGVLGNLQAESTINPNVFEDYKTHSDDIGNYGYGLPQWTPWLGRYYTDSLYDYSTPEGQRNYHGTNSPTFGRWCIDNGLDKSLMDVQLDFIHRGLGGYKSTAYDSSNPITWSEFITSTLTPNELAKIFYRNYERSSSGEYGSRPTYADNWYSYLTGEAPSPDTSGNAAIINGAISWAVGIANDDTHGYDQANRWGDDYDCSSLIIQAYEQAGCPVKTNGASSTANMRAVFTATGFTEYAYTSGMQLIAGDVLWREGHCAMYIGNGQIVSAHINELGTTTGGATGDQTGEEINVSSFSSSGDWSYILRLPSTGGTGSKRKGLSKLLLFAIASDLT